MTSRILVVYSNEPAAAGLTSILKAAGYEAHAVTTFEGALGEITERCPDLLVTAVRLGRFNGLHLSLRCHGTNPDLPILVVGIGSDAALANEAADYDVRFVVNPPTMELLATIREMLNRETDAHAPGASRATGTDNSHLSYQ